MEPQAISHIYTEELYAIPDATTVVLPVPWDEVTDEERTQLSRILNFIGYSLDRVRLVTTADLSALNNSSAVISFGVAAKGLELYQLYQAPGRKTILSEPLGKLLSDPAAKQKLAACLKQAFSS